MRSLSNETEKESADFVKVDKVIAMRASKKGLNKKILKQVDFRHCQTWKFPNNNDANCSRVITKILGTMEKFS